MSSSESDDEETRRISEAVACSESRADFFLDQPISKTKASPEVHDGTAISSTATTLGKESCQKKSSYPDKSWRISVSAKFAATKGTEVTLKKSNRPQMNDVDDDMNNSYILKTTPEFRAFVAKRLEKLLDEKLETWLTSSAWKCDRKRRISKGVKLLSDSTAMIGDNASKDQSQLQNSLRATKTVPVKRRRLSTSSESSEDEKIQACVFSVQDIIEENKTLAFLASEKIEDRELPTNTVPGALTKNEQVECLNGESLKACKKKKKKKKKKKAEIKEANVS